MSKQLMKYAFKSTWMRVSITLLLLGALCLLLERSFYGHLDENNVLQASLFLPLGAFSLALGCALGVIAVIMLFIRNTSPTN